MSPLSLLALLATGGCTLLVDAELADKPLEAADAGGVGGGGTSTSSVHSSSSGLVCPPNMANCDGIAAHGCNVNLTNDPQNCGSCGDACVGAMMQCTSGSCACPPNMANCDGIAADGCNVNLMNDPLNCGSCHDVCLGLMAQCAGGKCK